ncbi:MAG: hydrogenase nickel incorporation protein HypB [Lachnospiraceae bacterium]|jgi:hydrogenase nickel incorporation protein HypB|nr:hydrogenase nickel incorporation protein HypB [Lachnospiraceae bacterium]MCH4029993.1 hydrogenase nickel incorporation protein HypB [Lachnospiraceae bacterium]MCH4070346.1 hydrogenase nickel incorporation protein HypB [Lachnospiraceae bacterium]MCI1331573.1 hydrogenase nickel incorporation protein HypB [Lachnospiraceae bacterium]MCI1361048.1 hydrogenase nickel incorporation protein HypB [Lachnospiraceae bacterium]
MNSNEVRIFETKERVLADNDAAAAQVRNRMQDKNCLFVNLMSSPGAGKTTTIVRTLEELKKIKPDLKTGVMEADVDSDVDARTVSEAGAEAVQLHTGGSCHMDADMTWRGLTAMKPEGLDLIILENVGNLVCPAEFDVGADCRVMILSVPEGDDKPLKYPLMFTVSDVLLVNKIDTAPVFDFDFDALEKRVHDLNPDMKIFPVCAKTGEGFAPWIQWLSEKIAEKQGK